ncbi:DUF6415 family natural product biosynthesis protein [Streptomyces sp. NPDC002676]
MTAAPSAEAQTDEPILFLIEAAFDTSRKQPTPERLAEIDRLLREEVARLLTTARAVAEHRPHRSRDWYALVNAVDAADDALRFQLGTMMQAALQVSKLARRLIELRQVTAS